MSKLISMPSITAKWYQCGKQIAFSPAVGRRWYSSWVCQRYVGHPGECAQLPDADVVTGADIASPSTLEKLEK